MTKNSIIKSLLLEIKNANIVLNNSTGPQSDIDNIKRKIARLESAIEVIEELPPTCKTCGDKGYKPNYEGAIVSCPECNPYGVIC